MDENKMSQEHDAIESNSLVSSSYEESILKKPPTAGRPHFPLNLKPKHTKNSMFKYLSSKFSRIKKYPIEYFENELYSLCYMYIIDFSYDSISLELIKTLHHIWELREKESVLGRSEQSMLIEYMNSELQGNPEAFNQYKLLLNSLDILSSLVIKWKISNVYNISYRFNPLLTISQVLHIGKFNKNYFSMETIANSFYVSEPPLSSGIPTEIKEYAVLMQRTFWDVLVYMLNINGTNPSMIPSISGILAKKSQSIALLLNATVGEKHQEYQSLEIPGFFKQICGIKPCFEKALVLKEKLVEFDQAYRHFEQSLFNHFILITKLKHSLA